MCVGFKDLGVIMFEGFWNGMVMMVYLVLYIFGCKGYELFIDCSIDKVKDFV